MQLPPQRSASRMRSRATGHVGHERELLRRLSADGVPDDGERPRGSETRTLPTELVLCNRSLGILMRSCRVHAKESARASAVKLTGDSTGLGMGLGR